MNVRQLEILAEFGIVKAYHVAPLHYVPFISRSTLLLSRSQLKLRGFPDTHFRRTSHKADFERGFGDRVYLSPYQRPAILEAKLRKGFPHIRIDVPIAALEFTQFDLCRFSVARTRYLRRGSKLGPSEASTNGRYYGERQLPVAREPSDMKALLGEHFVRGANVEIQVKDRLALPSDSVITCFSLEDFEVMQHIAARVDVPWRIEVSESLSYKRSVKYEPQVVQFVEDALSDCDWKGNGLDFDRLI